MASLQVRELPENIYSLLKRRAEAEHRSIAQEAIVLLAKGLDTSIAPKAVSYTHLTLPTTPYV